jgi:hypothetical protein
MNFLSAYSQFEYKKFFQDSLLTDNFRIIEEDISLEFKPQFIKKAELIGRDKSLELEVYEIQHNSEYDPRVGISKDFFRLMASYGSKRALAVFHSPNSKNYRLSLATVEYSLLDTKIKREYSNPRRYSFFLGPDAKVHTPYDCLIKKGRVKDFDDLQNRFSIEVVNKEFYKEIANWYFWTLKKVKFPDDAEAEKNGKEISVIRLITRLIFIWFMKVRKLVPESLFNENELKKILTDLKLTNDNYYKAILQNLFFATLNTKQEDRRFTSKKKGFKGYSKDFGNHNVYRYEEFFEDSEEAIDKYFMPIPFLNGGLFECLDYKTKTRDERKYIDGFTETKSQQPAIPNFLFFSDDKTLDLNKDYGTTNKKYNVRGLINTLSLYNFTIDENDPNDADVSLDPELLGKVFENLLASYNPETAKTARKSTGSYYTPRPIVDYMVDESLKQYFKTHIQIDDIDNKLNILFSSEDQSNPFNTELSKKLVNLIDSLRVVDPAVGSGAFPMRILNRLVFLLHKLDPDNSLWKQSQIDGIKKSVKDPTLQRKFIEDTERKFKEKNPDYGRKLYLIEKCIYGVDIQQIAVEIAKLRFFISLLVDEKVENGEIEPLPNLDFKLMQGNSLISSFAGIDFTNKPQNDDNLFDFDEKYKQLIEEFEELKSQYQNEPDVKNKNTLRQKIDTKLLEIFEEKLKQHYPQLKNLESKYSGREEIIEAEKKKLFKKIGVDVEQAEQDLIAYTEGRKQKDFFLWDVYFAEVFADAKGFDVVIGNPPYGVKYTPSEKQLLRKIYPESQFKIDSYSLFLLKSFDLLRQDGFCSYIISNTLLDNYFEEKVRELILQNASIKEINDLDDKVFETGVVHTMIFSFLKVIQTSNSIKCNYSNNLSAGFFQIPQDYFLNQEKFTFNIREYGNKDLISKIKKETIPLNTVLDMRQTIKTGNDDIYILSKPRKKSHKPILRGKDIFKYHYKPPSLYVNYGSHLACPRNHKIFEQPKILIREAGSTITATYDEDNYYIMSSLYNGILINKNYSLKFLLGIINSRLFQFLMHKMIFEKTKGAFTKAKIYHYEKLPIKISSESIQKPIIELVEKIIQKKQKNPDANTQSTEDQIDIMVYKLYNLTYEEVEIIDPQIGSIISKGDYEKFEI